MASILSELAWAPLLILLPAISALLSFVYPRLAKNLGLASLLLMAVAVVGLAEQVLQDGVYRHAVGGWGAPLGIELYADGLSLLLLIATVVVGLGVTVYASAYFNAADSQRFWPIFLLMLTALNALFLAADIFNLYVTLELLGLSAVALTALSGDRAALAGAMRYLFATLLGSLFYLCGVALLYHGYGTVDISLLATRVEASPVTWSAMGLTAAGLALKTALFPLHFWLPPAHASASAPVSALLSSLVVKGSFYILLRLWLEIFSSLAFDIDSLFGLLGGAAVLWGSVQALRQTRLKLLVAYSTVAQIGYLFLALPLAGGVNGSAWYGVAFLVLSHALAKSAMFMVAGNLLRFGGHDRIADLDRVVQRLPLTAGAFALAGVSIMAMPPSGGFIGKWLLLQAALSQGRWDIVVVMIVGGLLAAAYVFKVLGHAFTQADMPHEAKAIPARMEWAALLLALAAVMLGFAASPMLALFDAGDPFGLAGALP